MSAATPRGPRPAFRLVDSHCHLDLAAFDTDRPEVIERARACGVTRQVVPAVAPSGWGKLRQVCAMDTGLHAAYGLHPVFLDQDSRHGIEQLPLWLQAEQPCAVGECGLDFHVPGLDRERQQWVFEAQLEIAHATGLPVVVHALRAVEQVLLVLRRFPGLRGVVHSFSGSPQQAQQLWDRGFLVGLGGPVTYPRARRLRRMAATMPLEFLLLESDAPDQPDALHRGQRNEPARLLQVLQAIAELRGEDPAEIAARTSENARLLFKLPMEDAAAVPSS